MNKIDYDLSRLNDFFHVYAPVDVAHAKRNAAAYANDVYNLTITDGQQYVMRILRTQQAETVAFEATMQAKLLANHIRTPQYLRFPSGKFGGEYSGTLFTLSAFIAGKTPTVASLELMANIGATLARLHASLDGMQAPRSKMQWLDPVNVQEDLATYDGPYKERLSVLVKKYERLLDLDLPKALIHGDLQLTNVFADNNKVTAVFDMETAENTYRILDLARTYLSLRMDTDYTADEILSRLLEGYNATASVPLTQEEKDVFAVVTDYVRGVCATWHALHETEYAQKYLDLEKVAA